MKKHLLRSILILFVLFPGLIWAQGVTTSGMNGLVTDELGEALPGANVVAVHEPSGTKYFGTTSEGGLFTIQGMRVGGPYTVTISFIGFENYILEGVSLTLGETYSVFAFLSEDAVQLETIEITGIQDPNLSVDKTGAATSISQEQIVNLPTIGRSAQDYYRLTPAASGNSFGGRNNQFNNFSFDGALLNNPFGLDAAVAGGQAAANPISLDAVEQIQVSLSPFDVRQAGFTGAAVNLVTRSGTNEVSGSVFGFFRNENLTGGEVSGNDIVVPELNATQFGFRVGGPIVKNKLFFFVNYEGERREDAGSNFLAARSEAEAQAALDGQLLGVSRVLASDLIAVRNALGAPPLNYETGEFENFLHDRESDKFLIKLDWNAHPNHTVSFKYNFLNSFRDLPANESAILSRGPNVQTLQFFNSGYRINNDLNSAVLEVNSRLGGGKYSNRLLVVYQDFKDRRDPFSSPFPPITIFEGASPYIIAGHEPFSINNELDQEVLQISNNFDVNLGNHVFTGGFVFERFEFRNSFNLTSFGFPFNFGRGNPFDNVFDDVDQFLSTVQNDPAFFTDQVPDNPTFNNDFITVGQIGIYAQDEWFVNSQLKLTLGLRVDWPLFFDTEPRFANTDPVVYFDENGTPLIPNAQGVTIDNTVFPDQDPLFSPRFGFNYDVSGDKSFILRGGSGLFTGRLPFVWIANQVSNPETGFFNFNVTAPDFNFPQVWKSNLGVDKVLPGNIISSLDINYSQDVNSVLVRNLGIGTPTQSLNTSFDQRPVYGFSGEDRVFFDADGDGSPEPGINAFVFDNEDRGYQFNVSTQFQKGFENGIYATFGYNYNLSRDLSSIPAEISGDAFGLNPISGNSNQPRLTNSQFGNRHRFIGSASKKFSYGDGKFGTTLSFFFEYAEGNRFSYVYAGDLNGDFFSNDLIYIPTSADINNMIFATPDFLDAPGTVGTDAEQQLQRAALEAYISSDEYLRENRGQISEANEAIRPWFSTWDVRLLQDYNFEAGGKTNTIQFSIDILNFGNLLNSDWGVREINTSGIEFETPIGVDGFDGNGTPVFSFDPSQTNPITDDISLLSRWQIQFGLRYIFN
ncbi:MAG: TonB-dependent receptor [Bacteroidota bacterium]